MSPNLRNAAERLAQADESMRHARDRRVRATRAVLDARSPGAEAELRDLRSEVQCHQDSEDTFLTTARTFVLAWRQELEIEERARADTEKKAREVPRG